MMQPMRETWTAADGTVITIRPISAADLTLEQEFVHGLSASTGYQRLMSARSPSPEGSGVSPTSTKNVNSR